MDGESTATAKTEVTVPVGGEEIKLYVTEVTADGTPVALNDTFEYDVEINDGFVTLSETSEDATVLIINNIQKGKEPEPNSRAGTGTTEAPAAHPGSLRSHSSQRTGQLQQWRQDR